MDEETTQSSLSKSTSKFRMLPSATMVAKGSGHTTKIRSKTSSTCDGLACHDGHKCNGQFLFCSVLSSDHAIHDAQTEEDEEGGGGNQPKATRTRPRCCRAGAALAATARDARIQPVFCAAARSAARAAHFSPVTCPDNGRVLQGRKVSRLQSNASHSRQTIPSPHSAH